jgi:hypothetical protein
MALPPQYESICELPNRPARLGLQEWSFTRRFRVITAGSLPPLGPAAATSCPGIPPYGASYVDFISNETVPTATLIDYEPEPQSNPREWIISCIYSTRQLAPSNTGGLQSPPSPSKPGGSGSSNPDDPTQLLPKVSVGSETIRIPYRFDPQGAGRFKDANENTLPGGFPIVRYANSACESFASGASFEIALETFSISVYRTTYTNYTTINNTVNQNKWGTFPSRTQLLKPIRQSRELFGGTWYWLNQYDFVYDPFFFHTFTVLNAGFREITNPLGPLTVAARTLRDITNNGVRTSVEWPLNMSGQKIMDPGANGQNLIYVEFNKHRASTFSAPLIPFTLSDFGIN